MLRFVGKFMYSSALGMRSSHNVKFTELFVVFSGILESGFKIVASWDRVVVCVYGSNSSVLQ